MNETVFGVRGEGKTWYLIDKIKSSPLPCIVIDTLRDPKDNYDKYAIRIYEPMILKFDMFKIVYTPETPVDFAAFCYHCARMRNYRLIIDEVDFWSSNKKVPKELLNLYRYSRHYHIDIYASCRNPYEIHRQLRGNTNTFVIYRLTEEGYLKYFEFFRKGIMSEIRSLPLHKNIRLDI